MKFDDINQDNCRLLLAGYMEKEDVSAPQISKALGCSHATLARILAGISTPTPELVKQTGVLIGLGYPKYSKLSRSDKEKISEAIGTVGGGAVGFGIISAAISVSGPIAGLSAAGITSGLATMGTLVGGGMVTGVAVAAALPIAAGALGFGIIKGVKYLLTEQQLKRSDMDPIWEMEKGSHLS